MQTHPEEVRSGRRDNSLGDKVYPTVVNIDFSCVVSIWQFQKMVYVSLMLPSKVDPVYLARTFHQNTLFISKQDLASLENGV